MAGNSDKGSRDDFPLSAKRTIALRVNYRCSNPTCGANTSGPQVDPEKSLSVGVAAHITAASIGGPRYDSNLSEDHRKSPDNGIWLCQNCAKLVDNDPSRFSGTLLRHWKEVAEQHALQQIGRPSLFDKTGAPSMEVVTLAICSSPAPDLAVLRRPELIQTLLKSLPADIKKVEQAELLCSGRGALGHPYAVIGVGTNYGWDWNIILFTAGEFGWDLVARTSLESQKAWVPEVFYVAGTPGALAVTHVHGWGTGVFRRSTSWYRIAKGAPVPLLSYPYSFYVTGWGMPFDRELTSKLLSIPQALTQGALLDLQFDVTYSMAREVAGNCDNSPLFSISERLSMEWSESANVFVPRTAMDDFARIEEIWDEGIDAFIKRNSGRLQELERSGTEQQQRFIKEHLSGDRATP